MRFTSITHVVNNYQYDFEGEIIICIKKFLERSKGTNWSKLFVDSSGELVASYSKDTGLQLYGAFSSLSNLVESQNSPNV